MKNLDITAQQLIGTQNHTKIADALIMIRKLSSIPQTVESEEIGFQLFTTIFNITMECISSLYHQEEHL